MDLDLGATIYALGWSLLHFLWQGALIALCLEVALVALRKSSSDVRYAARCGALALMGLAPVITFLVIRPTLPAAAASVPMVTSAEAATTAAGSWSGVTWLALVVAAWSLGAGFLGVRLLRDYLRIRRLQKGLAGRPLPTSWQVRFDDMVATLGVRAIARVVDSAALTAPTVIGWMKPVVLMPARVLSGLSQDQIEALIAHELAHVRRHDFIINLLQSALEALLFYHPAVWWVSRGIRAEREYCCDDMALRVTTDEVSYARALTTLEGWRGAEPQIGMSILGGSLMFRIQRLFGIRSSSPRARGPLTALGILLVASTLGATAFGYAAPQGPEMLRELRAELRELRQQVDELRGMLHDFHNSHGNVTLLHHDDDQGHARHDARHDDGDDTGFHFEFHGDSGDIHEHLQDVLEDVRVERHGGSATIDIRTDCDDVHSHACDEHEDTGRFDIEIDGAKLHEHVQKALEVHGSGRARGKVMKLHGDVDLDEIHEHVQRALEDSGLHRMRRIELGGLHEQVQKALEDSGVHDLKIDLRGLEGLKGLRGLEHLHQIEEIDGIHEHVQKALEDSGVHDLKIDLRGLEGLKGLRGLEHLHRIEEIEEIDGIHGHVQKILEDSGVHSLKIDLDGLLELEDLEELGDHRVYIQELELGEGSEVDGVIRIEIQTTHENGDVDGGARTLKLRKHGGSSEIKIMVDGKDVDLGELEDTHGIGIFRAEPSDDSDLLEKIHEARKKAKAKERTRANAL